MSTFNFIDIGTSDFRYTEAAPNETGIYVEPLKYYLDKIPDSPNCIKENVAISNPAGTVSIFYVPEELIKQHNLPNWIRGCNSIHKYHPTVVHRLKKNNLDPDSIIKHITVPCITLADLFKKNDVTHVKKLKIDTEGHDCFIVMQLVEYMQSNNIKVDKLIFETNNLSDKELVDDTIEALLHSGFIQIARSNIDSEFIYDE
tara:strand:- start:778 stop:1380 length:603 start_codon:yes stop_codon:yes gene_type:complete